MERVFLQIFDERGNIARVGYEQHAATDVQRIQCVYGQAEDMVQRQGRDKGRAVVQIADGRCTPFFGLQHIRNDVAMRERRAFGHAGGAAGVLQKRQIVVAQLNRLIGFLRAFGQYAFELNRGVNAPRRNHLFHVAQDKVDDFAFETEHVAE